MNFEILELTELTNHAVTASVRVTGLAEQAVACTATVDAYAITLAVPETITNRTAVHLNNGEEDELRYQLNAFCQTVYGQTLHAVLKRDALPAYADHEDKQAICDALCQTFQLTRAFYDVKAISYDETSGRVTITFANGGHRYANAFGSSGYGMIKDIMNNING